MEKKSFVIVFLLSFFIIFFLTYENYFINNFEIKNDIDSVEVNVFEKYNPNIIDICYGNKIKCEKVNYKVTGNINSEKIGTYSIIYKARYKNKEFKKKINVSVVDKIPPTLIVEGKFDDVCPNGKVNNVIISANDNYDGDITSKVQYKIEGNKIVYKVEDSSSNTSIKEFDIIVKDKEAPTLILDSGNIMYLPVGSTYKEPGYVAIDGCDGDITKNVKVSGSVDTSAAGEYTLTYTATDVLGNTTTVERKIKIYNLNNYEMGIANGKVIYLTFDDGPGAYTENLLNILANYNVKATFFVVGTNNSKYDYLITREHNEGHTVGLHTNSHRYEVIYSSEAAYFEDLNIIKNKVLNLTGVETKIMRFPGGSSNTVSRKYSYGIMSTLTNRVQEYGYRYFDWTVESHDSGGTTSSDRVYQNVISGIKPNSPNVVLMHDIKPYTVNAIERIIVYGLANGYTFAPLTMDSPVIHQNVNN